MSGSDWPTRKLDVPERVVPDRTDELPAFAPAEYPPRRRGADGFGLGMLAGIVLVALAAAALAGVWLLTRESSEKPAQASSAPAPTAPPLPATAPRTTVPRVVGYKVTRALVVLGDAHLTPKIVKRQTRQPSGTVVSQKPKEGTEVDRKSRVRIVVDAPPPARPLPDLKGQRYADAAKLLEARGLQPRKTTVTTDATPGTVVDQAPKPGTKLEKGATVVLSVANARPTTTTTAPTPTATTRTTTTPTTSTPSTTARKPPPPPTGPTTMPDLVGQPQAGAWPALVKAGLLPSILYVPSQETSGTVVAQAKQSGATLSKGAHVQVNVSAGPDAQNDTTVPTVIGKDPQTARQALEAAGFTVQTLSWPASATGQVGRVVDEQPVRGARAPAGAQITIFVGRGS